MGCVCRTAAGFRYEIQTQTCSNFITHLASNEASNEPYTIPYPPNVWYAAKASLKGQAYLNTPTFKLYHNSLLKDVSHILLLHLSYISTPPSLSTQVNVTLHSHSCFPHSVSYTATVQEDLPHTVPGLNEQLLTVTNGTVATIIAPWINTTIIIHRSQDYLSVTLQVPEPLTRSSDITGLCSEGCPTGFEVSDTDVEVTDYMCADNRLSVLVMCLTLDLTLPPVGSMTYTKLCAYDILLTHNLDLLSLYFALNEDALMLPDVIEFEVTTSPTEITTSSSSSSSRTTPTPTDQPVSTIIIISPTVDGVISRTVCTQPLSPLMLFLSCLLLVSLRLR